MRFSRGIRDDDDLLTCRVRARRRGQQPTRGQQPGAIGQPDQPGKKSGVGGEEQVLFATGDIRGDQTGKSISRLSYDADDSFAVRGPGRIHQTCIQRATGQRCLIPAGQRTDNEAVLAGGGIIVKDEGKPASVGRKSDVCIYVSHKLLGRAAQHRSTIEILQRPTSNFTTHEVQVVAVGRKAQADIVHLRRRNDLGVAVGGDVADPEALQAVVIQHVEDVFGIGRNGDKRSLAGFRDLGDGDVLKGQGVAAGEEGVDTVGSGREQSKSNRAGDANAELVLASGCNYGRAGGRGNSAGWTSRGNCPHVSIGWAGGSALRHAAIARVGEDTRPYIGVPVNLPS